MPQMMNFRVPFLVPILASLVIFCVSAQATETFSAMGTLSCRSAKPGDPVELVVTVRQAPRQPSLILPSCPVGLRFRVLRKPRLLHVDGEAVWLFRYRVTPTQIGNYEIPPLRVIEGDHSVTTDPLLLHVSRKGELPPLSAKELSQGVNIPEPLSEEILKAAPQPTLKPETAPIPADTRPWTARATSTFWKGITAFWNYPGK
jgi:hypothetical protein